MSPNYQTANTLQRDTTHTGAHTQIMCPLKKEVNGARNMPLFLLSKHMDKTSTSTVNNSITLISSYNLKTTLHTLKKHVKKA